MYKVLLDSNLILKGLQQDGEFDCFWEILKSSERYEGYITDIEWSKFSSHLDNKCKSDVADNLVSNFSKVLNITNDSNEDTYFDYIVSEEMTSTDSNSRYVSFKQFFIRYELDKIYNTPYDEGVSEPLFNLESNSLTGFEINGITLDGHNGGEDYLFGSATDSLTEFEINDITLDGHNGGEDYLFGSATDSLTEFEINDITLDGHNGGEDYLFGSATDSLIGIGNNGIIAGERDDLLDGHGDDSNYLFGSGK
jgi:hypothetical protein